MIHKIVTEGKRKSARWKNTFAKKSRWIKPGNRKRIIMSAKKRPDRLSRKENLTFRKADGFGQVKTSEKRKKVNAEVEFFTNIIRRAAAKWGPRNSMINRGKGEVYLGGSLRKYFSQ